MEKMIKLYAMFLVTTWIPLLACLIIRGPEYFGDDYTILFGWFSAFSLFILFGVLIGRNNEKEKG